MMVVVPRLDIETSRGLEKPRIISEIRKCLKKTQDNTKLDSKPRLSGTLQWRPDSNTVWQARHVEVRDGSLVVLASSSSVSPELRIPLRHLNLQPGCRPRAFCLSRGQAAPVASLQASTEQEYERWVKTLAVELMRQTPLEAIRFLDILGITSTLTPSGQTWHRPLRRGASEDNLSTLTGDDVRPKRTRIFGTRNNNCVVPRTSIETRINRDNLGGRFRIGGSMLKRGYYDFIENDLRANGNMVICEENEGLLETRQNSDIVCVNKSVAGISSSDSESDDYEREFAELIVKCQQVENYVPVREKRRLFESLGRGRRLAQSSENLSGMISLTHVGVGGHLNKPSRAQSLHDLSRLQCSMAVSEICRFFEQRGKVSRGREDEGCHAYLSRRRLQRSERKLARIKQETVEVEEELWRIQDEMAVLDKERSTQDGAIVDRSLALQRYHALEAHLTQEEDRLNRLQKDAARVLKEVELAANKFESALVQDNGDTVEKNNSRQ